MKKLKGVLNLMRNLAQVFYQSLNTITSKEDCFWVINQTFFLGENAKKGRDEFQREYNQFAENFKTKAENYKIQTNENPA